MYAGIDCGTQGTKVVLYDENKGNVTGRGYSPHELISKPDGTREQEPQWWIDALKSAMREALKDAQIDAEAIKAIGVSGQQHGLVILDKDDKVIRPAKLWCDTSTHQQNAELVEKLGGPSKTIDAIGTMLNTGYTVSKVLWLKQHEPQNYQRINSMLLPHDYLNFWLCGEKTTDSGDASGTGYFDIRTRTWSEKALLAIDNNRSLLNTLPKILQAEQAAGQLTQTAASALGLKAGILISSGGGDNMMGAIGTGNVNRGMITVSLGTSGTIYASMDNDCVDSSGQIASFCSSTNSWLPLICTMNVTNVTSLTQSLFAVDNAHLEQLLKETNIGADGLLMLPFLNGERAPDLPTAKGSLHGLTPHNMTQANICRAAIEGTSMGLRYGLQLLNKQGLEADQIRLIGGGANNLQWRQVIADMMNTPVVIPAEAEAAALGAALQAQWCDEQFHGANTDLHDICANGVKIENDSECLPISGNVVQYDEAYTNYDNLKQQLHG